MTDEEKKSIEIIKYLQYKCIDENETGMMPIYRLDDLANAIKILLNLIKKQSKEIEELNKKWEDKIKAKIEDLKENSNGDDFNLINVIMILQSLLEKE